MTSPCAGGAAQMPEFGEGVAHTDTPCGPRELYVRLLDVEHNVRFLEPAFRFARAALEAAEDGDTDTTASEPQAFVDALCRHASPGAPPAQASSAWWRRIVQELGPMGLLDGVWLQGVVRLQFLTDEAGERMLKQMMIRFGDPASGPGYAERYALLMRSVGLLPASIVRDDLAKPAECAEVSYEHALLGQCLALFPSAFRAETFGFNLWHALRGPCALLQDALERASPEWRRRVNDAYLRLHDRGELIGLAREASVLLLKSAPPEARGRLARGFMAADRSYRHWESAMLGRNIPLSVSDFMLEMIRRKGPHTFGHHDKVKLGGRPLEELFAGGPEGHRELLQLLAASHHVRAGDPDRSRLLGFSISLEGPMFDVFTAAEKETLREWIETLGRPEAAPTDLTPAPLMGVYTAPHEGDALQAHAMTQFTGYGPARLVYAMVNADRFPAIRLFARSLCDGVLGAIASVVSTLETISSRPMPAYSPQALVEMVKRFHDRSVSARRTAEGMPRTPPSPPAGAPPSKPALAPLLDGYWAQGFIDVLRADRPEYGWLFRIYASELGDGRLDWNHNLINRMTYEETGTKAPGDATEPEFYKFFGIGPVVIFVEALSLNTRDFLPELLGINLAIETNGVGGLYISAWKAAVRDGMKWKALTMRLHNSIDNLESGHTSMAIAAIETYLARLQEAGPDVVQTAWRRIWSMWRLNAAMAVGTPEERDAVRALAGGAASFAPTDALLL